MSSENIKKVQGIYDAFTRGDVPAIMEQLADDVDWGVETTAKTPWYAVHKGRNETMKFFQALGENIDFTKFETKNYAEGGEWVYCTLAYEGRIKKNGKVVSIESFQRWRIVNGRVVQWRENEDSHRVHEAWNT